MDVVMLPLLVEACTDEVRRREHAGPNGRCRERGGSLVDWYLADAVDQLAMFTLRCTQKLLVKLKTKPSANPPTSTTRLGDWYANTLNLGRERLVLCVSELTLLPVLVPAAGPDLAAKLTQGLRATLEAMGASRAAIEAELRQMADATMAKTANRVVLGSMNDFEGLVAAHRAHERSLVAVGLKVGEAPCKPINYERPRDAALAALAGRANPVATKLRDHVARRVAMKRL